MLEGRSLWELVVRRAEATPDRTMVVDESGRRLTFAEFASGAERVAAALHRRGVGRGTVVSWQLPTWIESMLLTAALSRLDAVQNPILHIYREREVGFILRQARTELFLVPEQFGGFDFLGFARRLAAEAGGVEVDTVTRGGLLEADPGELPPPPEPTDPDQAPVRWYFYTSGTTADPKGAQHTDHTIMAAARGMSACLRLTDADRSALVFPYPHIGGIIWLFSSQMTGCELLIDQTFDPVRTTAFLHERDVTLAGSGTVFHQAYLARKREQPDLFPHVRGFPGGGAPKPPQLHYDLRAAWPDSAGVLSGYGLTEAPILTMATPDDPDDMLARSEGRPMPGVELELVTLDGRPAAPGEEGEVRARAPQLMRGYLDPALDAEAFDEQGRFRTGDLGRLEDGYLIVTGRLKDIIIRKGENVSAKEVEDVLFRHPSVADVAVIGLPDPERGERVCAVVVTADGAEPLTMAELQRFCEEQGLSRRKWPEQLEFVDVLPRNPAGKVLKQDLKARFSS